MKTKTKSQEGFTLVELMIAIAAGAILVLAAGIVLSIGHTSWNKAWKKVNLQREASYAMLSMSRPIKAGTSAQVEDGGKTVVIYEDANSIRFSQPDGTNDLQCQAGGQPYTLINGKVESLLFTIDPNKPSTVTIDLKLTEDGAQTHFVSTVMMRNY